MSGRALLMLGAGFAIWASAFVMLYAMLSIGCRFGWDGIALLPGLSLQRAQLALILLLHLAAGAALALKLRAGPSGSFVLRAAYLAALAALASSLFTFAPVFALPACL